MFLMLIMNWQNLLMSLFNLMEAVTEATDDHFQSANYTQIDAGNLTTVMFQMSRNSVSWEADFDTCFSSIRLHL